MKRLYPWLIGVGLLGAGCSPKNDVQGGAPVLTVMTILESGGATDITGGEPACVASTKDGAKCDPAMDVLCQSAKSWCRCQSTNPMDPMAAGAWNCQFEPTAMVLAAFDRILDTEPLDYDIDAAVDEMGKTKKPLGRAGIASIVSMPGKAPEALTDYAANGDDSRSLIFKLLTNMFHGPHLIISGNPTLPSGSNITVSLDKTKVRAKDHNSLFVGMGSIKDGVISFTTAALSANITVPMAEPPPPMDGGTSDDGGADGGVSDAAMAEGGADGGADGSADETGGAGDAAATETAPPPLPDPVKAGMQTVTIMFNNLTDQAQIEKQITVTVNGTVRTDVVVVPTDADPTMPAVPARAYAVSPKMGDSWPAGAVITITVGADAADLQGVTLGSPASATFVTEP